jgi:hypothetical protein
MLPDEEKKDNSASSPVVFQILKQLDDRLALLQKQINILKEYSHFHEKKKGITFPYNPDYEAEPEDDKVEHDKIWTQIAYFMQKFEAIEDRLARLEEEDRHPMLAKILVRLAEVEEYNRHWRPGIEPEPSSVSSLNEACKPFYKGDGYEPSSVSECKHDQIFVADGVCKACGESVVEIGKYDEPIVDTLDGKIVGVNRKPKPTHTPEVDEDPFETIKEHAKQMETLECVCCGQSRPKPSVEKCETITIDRNDLMFLLCGLDEYWYENNKSTVERIKLALSKEGKC